MIYWTDSSKQGVFSVDKFLGASSKKSIHSMQTQTGKEPKAIKAVHSLVQPEGYNPCKGNDCEHLCIGKGFTCLFYLLVINPNLLPCSYVYNYQ